MTQEQAGALAGEGQGRAASREDLEHWVRSVTGAPGVNWRPISGGNRCQSWALDAPQADGSSKALYLRYQPPRPPSAEPYTVWREAKVYEALSRSKVPAPKLIAVNPEFQAILTERVPGRADYRRIKDEEQRRTVAREFIEGIATLHRLAIQPGALPGLQPGSSIADCVGRELDIWQAMYEETGRTDPLIDLAMDWLRHSIPNVAGPPVLVHGDAGPGNFLFENGHMTALLDWELAHAGDPMEDLAWFSMRCVMEPVPDFGACIREYSRLMGPVDFARIRYHRAFVSARVVIIRHRNVTGLPGNSIISRALNRRLLVAALADANGIKLAPTPKLAAAATPQTTFYESVISDIQEEIASRTEDPRIIMAAKNAAKVLKYLRDVDRLGSLVEREDLAMLQAILRRRPDSVDAGRRELLEAMRSGSISFAKAIEFFAASTERDALLAAAPSGGLAHRTFPPLEPN